MLDLVCGKIERIQNGEVEFLAKETNSIEQSSIEDVFTKEKKQNEDSVGNERR